MDNKTCIISITTDGKLGTVFVNGVDVTKNCCGYEIVHHAGDFPRVRLELFPAKLEIEKMEAVVEHA